MTDARRRTATIAGLAAAVLALHLWVIEGMPRPHVGAPPARAFTTRAIAAPEPAAGSGSSWGAEARNATQSTARARPAVYTPAASPPRAAPASGDTVAVTEALPTAPSRRAQAQAPGRALVPPSARFHYDVTAQSKGFTLRGTALLAWRNDGREYEAQLSLSAPLVRARTQTSTGLVTAQGLAPLRFSDKKGSEEAAHFVRDEGRITFSTNRPDAVLEPGAQDRLSVVLQLGAIVAGEPKKYRAGSEITVQTASTHEAEPWTFTVEGRERLELPGGRVEALRLTRNPRREYDVKVELWLAPGAAYAPVRLRLTQPNGDWVDQQWSSTDRG